VGLVEVGAGLQGAGGRGGEGGLDLDTQRGLVGLDREQVVGLAR